jgi:hypothetical protein
MRSWVLAAGLLAAAVTSNAAKAADLDEGPPPDRYGSAYEDPRYADIYRYPRPPAYAPPPGPPPGYYGGPVPRERVYRDDEDDYGRDDRGPPRYSNAQPRRPYAGGCVPREQVKAQLAQQGWQDFHDGAIRGEVATVHARRPSGRLFLLTLDRCSGEVVNARPLEPRPYGPYAYGGPPPRRWDRAY